jgi:hypothetical protein
MCRQERIRVFTVVVTSLKACKERLVDGEFRWGGSTEGYRAERTIES